MGAGMGVKEAMVLAFNPPPISGMSSTGGFEGVRAKPWQWRLERPGRRHVQKLIEAAQ